MTYQVRKYAYRFKVGYPNLQGSLDYYYLAQALVMDGLPNPIPAQWLFANPLPVDMPGRLEGQGLSFAGYAPVYKHLGLGCSIFFLRLAAKKADSVALHACAKTPPEISVWWLSLGSAIKFTTLPQAPVLGSLAPNTSLAIRACWIAPVHMAQGSKVTYKVQSTNR